MILRATFENIYSFKEETSISFAAGKGTVHSAHVSRAQKRDDISAVKIGVIYGANASGRFPAGDFEPFKLAKPVNPVSKIEIEFKTGGRYFAYGMEFSINGIKEEWLYEINSRSDKLIFTRKSNQDGNEFEFGDIHGDSSVAQFV